MPSLPRVLLIDLDDTIVRYGAGGEGLWAEVVERFAPRLPVARERLLAALDAVRVPFWADPERSRVGAPGHVRRAAGHRRASLRAAWGFSGKANSFAKSRTPTRASGRRASRRSPARSKRSPSCAAAATCSACVTNGGAPLQRAKIERYDLARFFDVVRIEGEVGVGKPEAAAFAGALAALGAAGEPAMMIGDDLEADVAGAQAAGLATVWVDHAGAGPRAEIRALDRVVRALAEVLASG